MSHNRDLIDTIKLNFARKSSAQLQEIVQAEDPARWSPEAVAAAGEILQDRAAGLAQEPEVAEEEPPPPPETPDPYSLALIVGLGTISAIANAATRALVNPESYLRQGDPSHADQPVPFGPKVAWLALDTRETDAVASALGLRGVRTATWAEGIEAAHQLSVFVTPPLSDWTLAVGTALFPPDRAEAFVKRLLERLSRQFGDAQYFGTHRDVELHLWARARQGLLVRGYGWLGEKRLTLWDEGRLTKEERDLGFRFSARPTDAARTGLYAKDERFAKDGPPPLAGPGDSGAGEEGTVPDEGCVMQLASLWSIDPTILDEAFKEPVMGLLGSVGWADNRMTRRN